MKNGGHVHSGGQEQLRQARQLAQQRIRVLRERFLPILQKTTQEHEIQLDGVWVFGSTAREEPSADSDVDLLVLTQKTVPARMLRQMMIRAELLANLDFSLDLVALSSAGYAERLRQPRTIARAIENDRVRLL